jgi:predicted ABC-type ATPase
MCNVEISKDDMQLFLNKRLEGKSHQGIGFILVGGPGSGKNTVIHTLLASLGLDEKTFALIDSDHIVEKLYDNNESCRTSANHINDFTFDAALSKHVDFIYSGTGRNLDFYTSNVIQKSKAHHYKLYLCIIENTTERAISRAIKRTLDTGRKFNIEHIKETYSKINENILTYMKLDCSDVDGIYVIDNSSETPQLLYTSSCENDIKSVKCYDVSHQYAYITEFCPSVWKEMKIMLSNGAIVALLNGLIAYYAIGVYKLHWSVLLFTSAILSYCTALYQTHYHTSRELVLISLFTCASIFFVLLHDFHLPEVIGIAILSGMITGYSWNMAK